jgi:hypothetical protein
MQIQLWFIAIILHLQTSSDQKQLPPNENCPLLPLFYGVRAQREGAEGVCLAGYGYTARRLFAFFYGLCHPNKNSVAAAK